MGLSNAERQQRWRDRQKAKLRAADRAADYEVLEVRIRELEAELRKQPQDARKLGNEAEAYLARLNALAKAITRNGPVEPREVKKVREQFLKMDRLLCTLEKRGGFPDLTERRAKVQALVERGATDGEKAAATAAMERLKNVTQDRSSKWSATAPEPLPKTREEMLPRKRPRKRQ